MRRLMLFIPSAVGIVLLACAPLTGTGVGRSGPPGMDARADAVVSHASGPTNTVAGHGSRVDSGGGLMASAARAADHQTETSAVEDVVIPLTTAVLAAVVLVGAIIGFAGLVGHHH